MKRVLDLASPRQLLSPWRIRWYTNGILIGLALAFLVIVFSDSGADSLTGRLGGDFPSFYSAGSIVAAGKGENLYSLNQQLVYQEGLLGKRESAIAFAYPSYTALLYAPLSQLPFRVAYVVHTFAMVAALALACGLLQRMYPQAIGSAYFLFAVSLTAFPIFWSVFSGQNTTLSLLLIVACFYNMMNGRNILAGIFLGLLFFKPQFAFPLAGLFLLSGRWQVCLSSLPILAAYIVAGTIIVDPGWLPKWLDATNNLFAYNTSTSVPQLISIMGLAQALVGPGDSLAQSLGWIGTAAATVAISWVWLVGGRRSDLGAQMALAVMFIILLTPVTAFYDSGLGLIALVVLFSVTGQISARLLVFLWLTGHLHLLSPIVGFSLTLIPVLALFAVTIHYLWRPAASSATPNG